MKWTLDQIPDQSGRVVIVTGANTGIGYETARPLALKGAKVILACRSREKGEVAARQIQAEIDATPNGETVGHGDANAGGSAAFGELDLSSLDSVRLFAEGFLAQHDRLDLLINNAGVMIPPESQTADGFELQIGVNYFGHFALTARLLPLLMQTPGSRVVTLSSLAARGGKIDFESFRGEKPYQPRREYCQSKLADLIFCFELQRRLNLAGSSTLSTAAHPGWTKTDLQRHSGFMEFLTSFLGMSPAQGALPTLHAAVAEVEGGAYFGPGGFGEIRGHPKPAKIPEAAFDAEVGKRLWDAGVEATGVDPLQG